MQTLSPRTEPASMVSTRPEGSASAAGLSAASATGVCEPLERRSSLLPARDRYCVSAGRIFCITEAKWASRAASSSLGLNSTNSEPASAFGE